MEETERSHARSVLVVFLVILIAIGAIAAALRSAPQRTEAFIQDAQGRSLVQHGFSMASSAKLTPDGLPTFTEAEL